MRIGSHPLQMNGAEPAIDQGIIHGWPVSWNPDDGRFYVTRKNGDTAGTFSDWRNTVQYCRTHNNG